MARSKLGNIIEDFSNLTDEKKEEYAEMFSEGNEDLKRLLIKMWDNGIQTYASCAGHDKSEVHPTADGFIMITDPYIFFDVKSLTEKQQKLLFKSLIMTSKKTDLIQRFEFAPDIHMGFERHGLTIRLKNEKNAYAVLNDIYDSVMQTSLLDRLKNIFTKKNPEEKLTSAEEEFVDALIQLNSISLERINLTNRSPEEKISEMMLEYNNKQTMSMGVTDGVKGSWYSRKSEFGYYSLCFAEGYYTFDERENVYYTLKNGEPVILSKNEIVGMKEYTRNRPLNFNSDFDYDLFMAIRAKVDKTFSVDDGLKL